MLPFKLSYYRQATQAFQKPRCYVLEPWGQEPSREGSQRAATRTSGSSVHSGLGSALPWPAPWPAATVTAGWPSRPAQGSRSKEGSGSSSPRQLCLGRQALGTVPNNEQATSSSPPHMVFLDLSPSQPTPATTTISSPSRNSWAQGPRSGFTSLLDASFRKLGASP